MHENHAPGPGKAKLFRERMDDAYRTRQIMNLCIASALLLLALVATMQLGGCVKPQSRPMAALPGLHMQAVDSTASETLAECRQMRDRSTLAAAGSAAAGALAGGLGAVALPVDGDRAELALGVSSAVTAALGAGLALLSARYSSTLDEHCTPWPSSSAPGLLGPLDGPRPAPDVAPVTWRQVRGLTVDGGMSW